MRARGIFPAVALLVPTLLAFSPPCTAETPPPGASLGERLGARIEHFRTEEAARREQSW